jgi:hypothetical protein
VAPGRAGDSAVIRDHQAGARRVAAIVTAVSLVFVATALVFLAIEIARGWIPLGQPGVAQIVIAVAIFALLFPLVGWIILRHDPSNRLGWIYLAIGFWQALNMFASGYSTLAYWVASGNLPLASELSWVAVWAWVPGFTLFSTLGILLFPTGRLPSRRWWPVVALAAVAFVLLLVPAVALWPYRGLPLEIANALNLPPPVDPVVAAASAIQGVGQVVLLAAMTGSVLGLAVRFRRSTGVERQQLKWFTYAAILDVLLLVAWTANVLDPLAGALSALLLASLPLAIGIAILRYRLYEIDRLISRTISYGVLTAIVAGLFVGFILVFQAVLAPVTGSNELAVAGSTLLAAALFQPIRRRVQRIVDRRFNRSRYDAELIVAAFARRLSDEVDLEALRSEILATVSAAVEPSSVSLWLRE